MISLVGLLLATSAACGLVYCVSVVYHAVKRLVSRNAALKCEVKAYRTDIKLLKAANKSLRDENTLLRREFCTEHDKATVADAKIAKLERKLKTIQQLVNQLGSKKEPPVSVEDNNETITQQG